MRRILPSFAAAIVLCLPAFAQTLTPFPAGPGSADPLAPKARQQGPTLSPIATPTLSPGVIELLKLEGEFEQAVAKGGGKAFSSWFADDAVTLNNGKPAVHGRVAIAAMAQWDPKEYQLTWMPEGAQLGPSGDTGFSWGHYDATSKDHNGNPVVQSGRYITFWKKVGGKWKVAMDASANDAPGAGDCCKLPTP
jgi:ketosteroid isomerase-like protein